MISDYQRYINIWILEQVDNIRKKYEKVRDWEHSGGWWIDGREDKLFLILGRLKHFRSTQTFHQYCSIRLFLILDWLKLIKFHCQYRSIKLFLIVGWLQPIHQSQHLLDDLSFDRWENLQQTSLSLSDSQSEHLFQSCMSF